MEVVSLSENSPSGCITLLCGPCDTTRSIAFHTTQHAANGGSACVVLSQRSDAEQHFFTGSFTRADGFRSGGCWDVEALRRVGFVYAEGVKEICEALGMLHTLPVVPDVVCIPGIDALLHVGTGTDFGAQAAVLHVAACIVDTVAYLAEQHTPVTVLLCSSNSAFDHFFQCLAKADHSYVRVAAEPQADGTIVCATSEGQRKARIVRQSNGTWQYS